MGKKFWANVILCVFIGCVASVVLANINSALTPKGVLVSDPVPSPEAVVLMDKVLLTEYNLFEDPGHVVKGDFQVTNASDTDILNVNVFCEFYDGQGNYLDREQWLLGDRIPAGQTIHHVMAERRFVNTASEGMQCRIVDFEVAKASFFELHRVEGGHHGEAEASGHGALPAGDHGHGTAAHGHH